MMMMTEAVYHRSKNLTDWNGVLEDLFGSDNSQKADSLHDSSSGFASDVPSYNSHGSNMSTFKGTPVISEVDRKPVERDRKPIERDREKGGKPPPWPSPSTPASYRNTPHYHPQDLNMHYRMSTPSPMSNRSVSSANTHSTASHISSHKSSSSYAPRIVSVPPKISYKNPAYEYQLDKHMEEIQSNIKRIELQETDKLMSSKGTKYRTPRLSMFDLITDEVIVKIFSNLSSDQLSKSSRVCGRWYRLVWDPLLWKHIVIQSEGINVDKALKYLTKRLSFNTPTVCVLVESICLNGCERLSDKGLHTIAKRCSELRRLELQGCSNISNEALFEVTSYCVNLEHLDVTGCPCVTSISLTDQMLMQASAHHLRQIHLRFLDMTDCYALDDEGLRTVSLHCSHLRFLYLRRCVRIGDNGLQFIAHYCSGIRELSISDCRKITDFGLCELAKLDDLRYLSVAKCDKVSDVGIIHITKHCRKLRYLNMRGCEAVSDDAMDVLARNCSRIRSLDIGKCDVTDEGLQVLAQNCSQLKKLSLKSCDAITDSGVKAIAKQCRNLQQLNIQDCHVTVDAYRAVKRYCKRCFIEHTNPGFY